MKKLILTDVDGTLTKKSVVLSHAGYLIEQGIIKDDGSYKAWSQDMKNESLIVAVAENYRSQITGLRESDMQAQTFIAKFFAKTDNWYDTLGRIKDKQKEGYEVCLVTGSSDFLIKHLADILQCNYHATEYLKDENGCFTGNVKGMFSETQKDDCVQWNYNLNEYDEIEAWGDTASDFGLFKHATYKMLVDPTFETLKTLAQKMIIDLIL
ncbi:MAG: HAD-IB family phosphatase [Carnobacterium sp.]|uniref:HAD family hydrolase n=1 Tax=Carnobacterium sp. TaxID=48221 RepID=UPI003315E56F